jgi:hypothetical protein
MYVLYACNVIPSYSVLTILQQTDNQYVSNDYTVAVIIAPIGKQLPNEGNSDSNGDAKKLTSSLSTSCLLVYARLLHFLLLSY